jgi:hypothetical protein
VESPSDIARLRSRSGPSVWPKRGRSAGRKTRSLVVHRQGAEELVQPNRQQWNLDRMTKIITRSSDARALARRLWEFFEFRLMCRLPEIDTKEPSSFSIKIEPFLQTHRPGDLAPEVVIRDSPRREEALVHELLHLNLIMLGYPKFRIHHPKDSPEWNLAGNILNKADHWVMLPTFTSFGYSEQQFLGPSRRPPTALQQRVHEDLEQLKSELFSQERYGRAISGYLSNHSIAHDAVWIAKMIGRD